MDETEPTRVDETVMSEEAIESERDSSVERFYAEFEEMMEDETENFDVEDDEGQVENL